MANELKINGFDAYRQWGIRMGDGFLDALGVPIPMKQFVESKSRLEHGKKVVLVNPRWDERDLTLTFTIEGTTPEDFQSKKNAFYQELYKVKMTVQVPDNGSEVYHLLYTGKSITYAQSLDRTFAKISVKFNEPNPAERR